MGNIKKDKNVTKSTLATTNANTNTNLPPTIDEDTIKSIADSVDFDGVKISGKTRDSFEQLSNTIAQQFSGNKEVQEAMDLLFSSAKDSGIVANGDTRATNKDDTPSMTLLRYGFAELCKEHCKEVTLPKLDANGKELVGDDGEPITVACGGGFRKLKNGNKEYFFIDADGNTRTPKLYCKKDKVETVDTTTDDVEEEVISK